MTFQSFERTLKQPSQVWIVLLLSLIGLLLVSGRLYAVPTMEFFAAGGNTTAQGPVLTPQVNTYSYNPNNPTDNAVVSAFPATSITYTLENQQYTSGTLADNGLFFGDSFAPQNIYIPLSGQGSPANTDFSSSRLNPANPQGIDITANYGQRMALNTSRINGVLRRNTTAINGGLGHYFGDIVLTWNRPVFNPIVNVSGLGGTGGSPSFGFAAQFELSSPPSGTTMSLLSGRNTAVSGLTIRNNATTIGATAAAGGSSGSIQILNTNSITSLRFRIYVRSSYTTDTTNTNWGTNTGDAFLFSSSSVDAIVGDLFVSKTNNVTSVTSGGSTTYTVRVTNNGPSTIDGAILNDVVGAGLNATSAVCSAAASNRCTVAPNLANLTGAGVTLPSLASGQFYEISVTANVSGSGSVINSARISLPASNTASNTGASCVTSGGVTRSFNTTTGACTSTDTDTVTIAAITPDSAINEARFTIVPDLPTIYRGGTGTQLVSITNNGPSSATGTVATFIPATQTGVSVTAVNVVGGAVCTLSGGEWSCPVGGVANGENFQLNVTYSTTAASSLGVAQQATIKVRSNEFNPGSGVGETLYKVWGSNEQNEIRPNGAFWVGYTGTGGSAQVGANSDENTPVLNAWPSGQTSPTGAYLTQANIGSQTSVYGASSTTASPIIQRVVTDMSTDPDRSVNLTNIATTSAGDNRRAWEYRTGVYIPTTQSVSFCIGNTTLGIDDNAYIVVDGVVQGVQDSYVPGGFVSASLSLSAGYHSIVYRMVNQNTYAGGAERSAGGYGQIGISLGGICNTANLDIWTNTAVPASINIIDAADLQITKSNSVSTINAGGTTAYSIVVTNAGPSAANGALFRDIAAAGLSKTSITCGSVTGGAVCPTAPISIATVEGGTGIAIPTMPSGGSVTFTINASVTASSGNVTNTATVTAPAGVTEINTANNTASDTDNVVAMPVIYNCPTGTTATGSGYATSGTGAYRDRLFWLDWSCGGATAFNIGDTVNKSWVTPTGMLISATLTNIASSAVAPYNTGDWAGDDLDDMYSGVNPIGLRNVVAGQTSVFDITWSSSLNGISVPVDLVMADAEDLAQSSGEYTEVTTNGDSWQLIESQGNISAQFTNAAKTLRFTNSVNNSGGTALAVAKNITSSQVAVKGGGISAIAFAIAISDDFGDAPLAYGTTGHYLGLNVTGGGQPSSPTDANSITKATLSHTTPVWMGTLSPDFERTDQHSANATGDDSNGIDDEDGINPSSLVTNSAATSFSSSVIVNNTLGTAATLVGWIDWNNDNAFQASEASEISIPAGASNQLFTLNWNNLTGLTAGNRFARFRVSSDPALNTAKSSGGIVNGEVEDYIVTVEAVSQISGRVFNDNSGSTAIAANAYNAIQDTGEIGLAGSTIELNNCAGAVIATTQTDGAGDYNFVVTLAGLSSPNFCITQTNLTGYTSVSGTAGYTRTTDTITVSNTSSLAYPNHNFGDARLTLILTTDGQQTTTPSGTVSYAHVLTTDAVLTPTGFNTVATEQPNGLGWTSVLYRDTNCNGVVDAGEGVVSSLPQLLPNDRICVVQRVNAPATASAGAQQVATLSASYTATVQDSTVLNGSSNSRTDTTLVATAGLDMRKQVRVVASCPSTGADVAAFSDRNTAKNGDFLEYEIIYTNRSTRNLSEVKVRDFVPSHALFKTASCQSTPNCSVNTQPAVNGSGEVSWLISGPVRPAVQGNVRFCVQVPPLAEPPIQ